MILVELSTVPATALPVSELAAHLHLGTGFADDGSQDSVIEAYLRAALSAIEARLGKALFQRQFSWQLTAWRNANEQGLPIAPVQTITAVRSVDQAGTQTLVEASQYHLIRDSQRPRLAANGASLPAIPAGGHVEIEFEAGYGAQWADIPVDLAQAVFLLATHYYDNRRGEGSRDALMPFGVMALIDAYRSVRLLGGRM